ncbi:MAG: 6-phosphogluconolactonase [Frankiales bacterium]|jgi:6-phosphogluconolactonase (cycloisomerase 2 family)|nr:6-phosphogluconolactonase [Frankiales bacterium]
MQVLLVGCYTAPQGTGTGVAAVNGSAVDNLVRATSPSFVAAHPTLPVAYAVLEQEAGALLTFGLAHGGGVIDQRGSGGAWPCHVAVSEDGRWAGVAHYGDGTAGLLPLGADGAPAGPPQLLVHEGRGPDTVRQAGPHAHQVVFAGELLLVVDLGSDAVHRYQLVDGRWVVAHGGPARLRSGCGPRHLIADGTRRWVVGELDATVTGYDEEASGRWRELGSCPSTATATAEPVCPSHIGLRDGHLYVSNREPGTIAVFAVGDGAPTLVGEAPTGGRWPRHFAFAGATMVVANERSDEVTWLPFDQGPVPGAVAGRVPIGSPTCVAVAAW